MCGRRVHVENDMVTASVIRVKGGCGNMRVRINGKAMNQFIQLTLLEISSSLMESVKMEFIIYILVGTWILHRDCIFQMWMNA